MQIKKKGSENSEKQAIPPRYYYGWISHLISGAIIFVTDSILIYPNYKDEPMPAYANGTWNMFFRFPVWFFGTLLITKLFINRSYKQYSKPERRKLYVINIFLTWTIMFVFLFIYPKLFYSQLIVFIWGLVVLLVLVGFSYITRLKAARE